MSARLAKRHGLVLAVYALVVLILMWPMFGPGSPPGVDTPTFLHLAWMVEKGLTGHPSLLFNDPYWYGGWPYLASYPPLAYGAIGFLSAISPIPIEISFRIWTFVAYVAVSVTTYALALELGTRKLVAAWAGLLALFSYAMFVSLGIFGWYSTVFALPFATAGFTMMERSLRTLRRRDAAWGGMLFAASLLSHHMTAIAFGLSMVPWAAWVLWPRESRRPRLRMLGTSVLVFLAVSALWLVFFIPHVISVGFEREVPGNWIVNIGDWFRRLLQRDVIGIEVYPTYVGLVQVPLAVAGLVYAFTSRTRATGAGLVLLMFVWFALGSTWMPLVRFYPLSGLDVARFIVFMVPFMAVLGAHFIDVAINDVFELSKRIGSWQRYVMPLTVVAMLLLLIVPVRDSLQARSTLKPVTRLPELDQALQWIKNDAPEGATVLGVGFRNWDDWWIPELTGHPVMDGWNDEGAAPWREIRTVRIMGWSGNVNTLQLYSIMEDRKADYLVVYHWQPLDSPDLFEAAALQDPFLFARVKSWPGVSIFERLGR